MAGFSSLDDLVNQVTTNNKFFRADWNKNHATAGTVIAGSWQCLAGGAGNPPANTQFGGTTLIPQPCYDFGPGGDDAGRHAAGHSAGQRDHIDRGHQDDPLR
jgi:hypothetical protein